MVMNSPAVAESITRPNPPDNHYRLMLKESVDHFLLEYKKGGSDFSGFASIFFRLIQAMADPPLEITWFYSAVTFHGSVKSISDDPFKKVVVAVKDLFQLLVSCSSQYNGLERIAVIAPILYELYFVAADCLKNDLCLKKEIEGLVEGIVTYIVICCSNYSEQPKSEMNHLTAGFVDLTRVWTVDQIKENCDFGDNLRVFLPLVSDDIRHVISVGTELSYLAGIVMVEAFLFRLCLKFGPGISREELQKDMLNWAVQTIRGFQSYCFLDMLLRMLLEQSLPMATLLVFLISPEGSSEDEDLFKQVLYDAVILEEYSFLNSRIWTQLPGDYSKNLALRWLLVADNAIHLVRENCDQTRSISYIDAFSRSCLPNQLIKWVTDRTATEDKISRPNVSTPKALIRWLLVLEDQGVKVFNLNSLKLRAKSAISRSKVDYEPSECSPDHQNQNFSIFSTNGSNGFERWQNKVDEDQEMVDLLDDASISVPSDYQGQSVATEGRRKRKEGSHDRVSPIKLAKCK